MTWRGAWARSQWNSQPIYFVSSNPHSLPNLLSGYALSQRDALVAFARQENPEGLADEWDALVARGDVGAQANYLYYIQRAYRKQDAAAQRAWAHADAAAGIHRFDEPHSLDISAQVIELCRIDPAGSIRGWPCPGWRRWLTATR